MPAHRVRALLDGYARYMGSAASAVFEAELRALGTSARRLSPDLWPIVVERLARRLENGEVREGFRAAFGAPLDIPA